MDVRCAKCGRVTTHQRSSAGELECVRCRVMAAPPTRWCAACNDNTAQDSYGCVACRHRAAERSDAISRRNRRYAMIGVGAGVAAIVAWRVVVAITATDPPAYDPSTYKAQAPTQATPSPSPALPEQDRAPLSPAITAPTPAARAVGEAVIAWCGHNGKAALWRGDFNAEVVDIGKGRFNVIVDHMRKDSVLGGHVLWYMATTKGGRLDTVTPRKRISATACRGLDAAPLEADVPAHVR